MPNAVSSAYFAVKNYEIGKKDDNIFRTGIGAIQTSRVINSVQKTANIAPNFGSGAVSFMTKLLYPLIIASGTFSTIMSEDKVKTGVSQVGSISFMYMFEKVAESILKIADKAITNTKFMQKGDIKSKAAYLAWKILKGASFAAASLSGYNIGNNTMNNIVDKHRAKKESENKQDSNIFSEMSLE